MDPSGAKTDCINDGLRGDAVISTNLCYPAAGECVNHGRTLHGSERTQIG